MMEVETTSTTSLPTKDIVKNVDDSPYYYAISRRTFLKPTTVHHWQLRDLVHVVGDQIYSIYQDKVTRVSTTTGEIVNDIDLDFDPTCIAINKGLMAVGGKMSELAVKDLASNTLKYRIDAGSKINNSVSVSRPDNATDAHLLLANNDKTIKIYSIPYTASTTSSTTSPMLLSSPTFSSFPPHSPESHYEIDDPIPEHYLDPIVILRFPVAMNYTAVSPDGRHMVAVGDSRSVYVHSTNSDRSSYQKIYQTTEALDSGFSCSWNNASTQYAVASQDGLVCVWDIRSQKAMAKLRSKRPSSNDSHVACRNVKFCTSDSLGMLAFTEHHSHVHIVDTRNYSNEQVIKIPTSNQSPELTGLSWSDHGTKLYVGTLDNVVELQMDSAVRRCFSTIEDDLDDIII